MEKVYKMSEEQRAKMRKPELWTVDKDGKPIKKSKLPRPMYKGEYTERPVYDGYYTPPLQRARNSTEYKLWKKAVLERDGHACIWCGDKDSQLHVDHIKPFSLFPELRTVLENGRTLCWDCHTKTDTYGGKMNRKKDLSTGA